MAEPAIVCAFLLCRQPPQQLLYTPGVVSHTASIFAYQGVADPPPAGFLLMRSAELSQHDKDFMEQALKQLEKQTGVVLPEGRNPDIRFLSHLWDPLKVSYKPMLFYVAAEVLAQGTQCFLQLTGFKKHQHSGHVFYTYGVDTAAASHGDGEEPLLFVHGVGAGLLPYLLFIYKLTCAGMYS